MIKQLNLETHSFKRKRYLTMTIFLTKEAEWMHCFQSAWNHHTLVWVLLNLLGRLKSKLHSVLELKIIISFRYAKKIFLINQKLLLSFQTNIVQTHIALCWDAQPMLTTKSLYLSKDRFKTQLKCLDLSQN